MSKAKNDKGENNNISDAQGLLIVPSVIKNKEREPKKSLPSKTKEKTIKEETTNKISPIFKEKNEFKKEIPEDIFTGKNENEEEKPEEEEFSFSEEKNDFKQEESGKKKPLIPLDETNKNIDQDLKKKESLFSGNIKLDPKHMFTTVNCYKSKIKMNKSNNNTNENEVIAFISNDDKINPQKKNINNITKFINLKVMNANEFQISVPNNEYCEYLKYKDEFQQFLSKKRKSGSDILNKQMILADEKAKIIHEREDSCIDMIKEEKAKIKEAEEILRKKKERFARRLNEEEEFHQNILSFIKSSKEEIKP